MGGAMMHSGNVHPGNAEPKMFFGSHSQGGAPVLPARH